MLEKLTKKQEKIMEQTRNEWLKMLFSGKTKFNETEAKKGIKWLYEFSNLKSPKIVIVDSPFSAQKKANELNKTKKKHYEFSVYGNIGDYGWVSFYDFFTKIGILKDNNFEKFKKLLKSGIYDMIQFDEVCIVCKLPSKIRYIKENGKYVVHSYKKHAIEWEDGFFLNGLKGELSTENLKDFINRKVVDNL